jgi:hypothetical protein
MLALLACAGLAGLALGGCAPAAAVAPEPVAVQMPVPTPIYCSVPLPAHPALPISALSADSPPADTIRTYAATVVVLKSAVIQRDSLLAACAAPPADANANGGAK